MLCFYEKYAYTREYTFRKKFWNFITKLLHVDIDERLSIEETLEEYKNILGAITIIEECK